MLKFSFFVNYVLCPSYILPLAKYFASKYFLNIEMCVRLQLVRYYFMKCNETKLVFASLGRLDVWWRHLHCHEWLFSMWACWVLPTEGLPDISDEIAVELVSFKAWKFLLRSIKALAYSRKSMIEPLQKCLTEPIHCQEEILPKARVDDDTVSKSKQNQSGCSFTSFHVSHELYPLNVAYLMAAEVTSVWVFTNRSPRWLPNSTIWIEI